MHSSNPKRHHYIPQFIIRNFAGDQGKVWVYNKNDRKIFASKPSNVFVVRNLYRQYDPERRQYHVTPEERLAEMESDAAPILRSIVENVRQNKRPDLSADLYERWMRFWISLLYRNFRVQQISREAIEERLCRANPQVRSERSGLIMPYQVYKKQHPEEHEMIYKEGLADMVAGIDPIWEQDIERRLRETHCVFAYIPQPSDKQFVLGNSIAILLPEVGKNSGSFLPITPDIAIVYMYQPGDIDIYPLTGDVEHEPDRINQDTFQKSNQIISHSKTLLESLAKSVSLS